MMNITNEHFDQLLSLANKLIDTHYSQKKAETISLEKIHESEMSNRLELAEKFALTVTPLIAAAALWLHTNANDKN